jgi:hypothetical protein
MKAAANHLEGVAQGNNGQDLDGLRQSRAANDASGPGVGKGHALGRLARDGIESRCEPDKGLSYHAGRRRESCVGEKLKARLGRNDDGKWRVAGRDAHPLSPGYQFRRTADNTVGPGLRRHVLRGIH